MLELNLTKNTNEQLPGTLGKYYPRVEYKDTIGINKLAKHMHSHNAVWSRGLVVGLLTDLVDCIKELSLQGYVVKIDDLGLFKATVEGNGLTLKKGAKVSAGKGVQRKDEELNANIALQQFAISNVKMIMQATGETTIERMSAEASTTFTSKAKALIKSLTGVDAVDPSNGGGSSPAENAENAENGSGNSGSNSGSQNSGSQSQQNSVAAPTISGVNPFEETSQVSISGPDGATIYYSENGDDPDSNDTLYTQPFTIDETTTIKAIAIKDGVSSQVTTKVFTKGTGGSGGFETGS